MQHSTDFGCSANLASGLRPAVSPRPAGDSRCAPRTPYPHDPAGMPPPVCWCLPAADTLRRNAAECAGGNPQIIRIAYTAYADVGVKISGCGTDHPGSVKNRLLSIWNAAMQHLLLSQRHQKLPYPQRNGYNPFPMALGVALNNLPGCAAAGTADGQFTSTGYVPPLQSTQFPTPQSGRDCQCVVRPIQNCFVLNKHFFK